ncbi:hypothetical protein [Solibacillus sp. FSL K6-1523]|uniref:hypothetical protein n=1 Tax=Solibacillus sp. FSL K6-1523 TaxID=2921471 RepID=UPI0030FB7C72
MKIKMDGGHSVYNQVVERKLNGMDIELKAFFNEYLKNPRPTDDKITYEGMRKVVGGNGSGTIDGLFPIVIAGYEFYVKDFVTLANPNATLQEQNEATLSILSPFGKARKVEDLKDTLKKMEKVWKLLRISIKTQTKGRKPKKPLRKK